MWQYLLVFIGSLFVDVVPLPLPPAFTIMIFLQIRFKLNIWAVLTIGVFGSVVGRYILSLYIPKLSSRIFNAAKNEDVQYLGKKLKEKGWKSKAAILVYSLLPLPTTPLFIAGGMAKLKPLYIIPPFIIGKFISDMVAVLIGKYAAENTSNLMQGMVSWQSITGFGLGLILIFILVYIDWRSLLTEKKFRLKFKIMK